MTLVRSLILLLVKIVYLLYTLVRDYGKQFVGYILIIGAGIALAVVFPWILILYALVLGHALISR